MDKKKACITILLVTIYLPLIAENTKLELSGPLYGKNYYLPHLLTYSFPGFSPNRGVKPDSSISITYTGINEFVVYNASDIAMDYESSVLESSYTYRPLDNLLIGVDLRFISYYGGFMDPVIDFWHNTFNFPDAGRYLFPTNKLSIAVDNSAGKDAVLTNQGIYLGDTDIYAILNLQDRPTYSLALAMAIKLPTGSFGYLTGSGFMDIGLQILGEWRIHRQWILGLQQAVVFPGDLISKSTPMHQEYSHRHFYPLGSTPLQT